MKTNLLLSGSLLVGLTLSFGPSSQAAQMAEIQKVAYSLPMSHVAQIAQIPQVPSNGENAAQIAQTQPESRKARRAAQVAATARTVDSMLRIQRFLFVPTRVVTSQPGMPYTTLNTYYEVAVTPDSLVCGLPYYGYVYNTLYDPGRSPFDFTALRPTIRQDGTPAGKQKAWVRINARGQYNSRSYVLIFEVFDNGTASLTIQGTGTQHLQYLGNLFPIPLGEAVAINPATR